jgi:hypothetical protein
MEEQAPPIAKRRGPPLGHPRWGGRKKGSVSARTKMAREIADAMRFDGVKLSIEIINTGVLKNADGTLTPVPIEERLKLLRDLQQYLQPKLSAVEMTGQNGGPVETASLNITQILADPQMAEAAQTLALLMAEQDAPEPRHDMSIVPFDR